MSKQKNKSYAKYDSLAPIEEPKEDSSDTLNITSINHRKYIIDTNTVVCIYLWGNFCKPCKTIAPPYAQMAKKYYNRNKCLLMKEDVELKFTTEYRIEVVPSFIFFKNGKIVTQNDGKILDVIGGDLNKVESILNTLLNTN